MKLGLGTGSIIPRANPANEAGSSTDEGFNTELD